MGFNGLIVTDATTMGGFTEIVPRSKAVPMSIANGADIFLFSRDIEEDFNYMKQGIEDVDGVQEFKKNNSDRFEIVRNAFSVVEMRYSVEISDPEIMYILNYF